MCSERVGICTRSTALVGLAAPICPKAFFLIFFIFITISTVLRHCPGVFAPHAHGRNVVRVENLGYYWINLGEVFR